MPFHAHQSIPERGPSQLGFQQILIGLVYEIAELSAEGRFSRHVAELFAAKIDELHFERIMTRKECARFLGVSLRTLDRWVKEEGLPSAFRRVHPDTRARRIFFLCPTLEWQYSHLAQSPEGSKERIES